MSTYRIFRSRTTKRRVFLRWESDGRVGFAFTETGRTWRATAESFYKTYFEV